MRELSFKGFLKQYVYSLSASKTSSLYKLANEAATTNTRLREPLFLYALFWEKENILLMATKDRNLHNEYSGLLGKYDKNSLENALASNSHELPERYLRIYVSYTRLMMRKKNNNNIKMLMHKEIRHLQDVKAISNYRLYTDLGLNPSNVNSFLKNGNVQKVSRGTADRIISYLEEIGR
jgi:DNA-binding Xre family transcriptional regulator